MSTKQKPTPLTVTVHVPLIFTVRGGRKTIIGDIPYTAPRTRFDDSIVKALARAHRWRSLIEDGSYASITELARDKGVNDSYACRLLRLTLLMPDIIEAVLDRRGALLTLDALMRPLPLEWDKQRSALRGGCPKETVPAGIL
jgi:hypothetical protein